MFEITTSLILFVSAFHSTQGPAQGVEAPIAVKAEVASVVLVKPAIAEASVANAPSAMEKTVREYFKDTPELIDIAKCESGYRQFDALGNVIRGRVNNHDVGVMQINEYYHGKTAQALGYNLETTEGNLAFARWLYKHEGSDPWVHSSPCWKKPTVALTSAVTH